MDNHARSSGRLIQKIVLLFTVPAQHAAPIVACVCRMRPNETRALWTQVFGVDQFGPSERRLGDLSHATAVVSNVAGN